MKIYTEDSIRNFNFWSGGADTVADLTWDDFDILEPIIEDVFEGECSDTELNDLFWFERDMIAQWLGYYDYDELMEDRK